MKLLLDTPTILWWWASPDRLSATALERLSHPDSEIFISAVSVSEMLWQQKNKLVTFPDEMWDELPDLLAAERWQELPLRMTHTARLAQFAGVPQDLFDSLLAAQAAGERMKFVTPDPHFRSFPGVSVLW